MRKLIVIILFASLTVNSISQSNNQLFRFSLLYNYDFNLISNNEINDYLFNNNFYSTNNALSVNALGFSLRFSDKPFIINMSYSQGTSWMYNSDDKSVLNLTGFGLEFGFDFIKSKKWLVAPYIGEMFNNYELIAVSKYTKSTLSKGKLEEAFKTLSIPILKIGVQLDRKISISYLNICLGIKGGYNIDFFSANWYNSNKQKLYAMPSINVSGFNFGFCMKLEFNMEKIGAQRYRNFSRESLQ